MARTLNTPFWTGGKAGLVMAVILLAGSLIVLTIARLWSDASPETLGVAAQSAIATACAAAALFGFVISRFVNRFDELEQAINELPNINEGIGENAGQDGWPRGPVGVRVANATRTVRSAQRAVRSITVEREQAQVQLEQLTGERAEFFSRLSHELRSPLNAILGYAAILSEEAPQVGQDHIREDVGRIKQAGTELLGLIDHLLAAADDRTGTTTVGRVPFDLGACLTTLVGTMQRRGLSVDLATEYMAGPTVYGNRDKVVRAISGLIDHAFREHPSASLNISSELRAGAPAEVHVHLDFDHVASATEAQVPATMIRDLADMLARNVGGQLFFQTTKDGRQRFTLAFPVDSRAIKVHDMQQHNQDSSKAKSADDKPVRTALVVDDDPSAVDLLSRWLSRSGYKVISATDAETGMVLAEKHVPDIVLLDALMPGKTGYDLLPEMRKIPALKLTPIIIVTVDDDRARGLEAGASDFVRKPVNEAAVRELLKVYEQSSSGDILIIEDDDDAAELLDRNVRRLGFETRRASNGEEGLAAVRERTPSAILLDLNMPKVNGFDFIDAIAGNAEFASIPMLVVSGEDLSLPQHHKLVQAGCRFYLKGNAAPREIAQGLREAVR